MPIPPSRNYNDMGLFDRIFQGETPSPANAGKKPLADLQWQVLDSISMLEALKQRSFEVPCLIFKHSTRCSISSMALNRLQIGWEFSEQELEGWFLDLIAFRSVSHAVSEQLGIEHQSPQAIIVRNGEVVYHASHSAIGIQPIREALVRV